MDAALYLSLRDEIQQDAARVERQLEELRRAESFLLPRIHSTRHLASYRAVLNDLASEITRAESEHAELLHLSRFVTRALITSYGKEHVSDPLANSLSAQTDASQSASVHAKHSDKALPPASETAKVAAPSARPKADQKPVAKAVPKTEVPLSPPKTAVIEFDKDGFPIAHAPAKSSPPAKMPAAITFQDTPALTEPPTVVFDENGFPLNPPVDETLNTLVEIPKTQTAGHPLTKKDT